MGDSATDLAPWYGAHYFRTYRGAPYERSPIWLSAMRLMAEGIIRECNRPRTVLDVGCAMGFLVEALRDRGVEAYGIDLSAYAIEHVHDSVKSFCWVRSLLDPIVERYDLIVCHEVLEHLPPQEAEMAVARLCSATDDVLFSSTPDGFSEDTHLNVQPVDYWAGLFAKQGFVRDFVFDGAGFLAPWACRFRRSSEGMHRTVGAYERRVWTLGRENAALRTRVMEQAAVVARQDQELRDRPDTATLQVTIEEQREHLDALNDRLLCMTDREADLRRMVLDAHEQLLQRDQLLIGRAAPEALQQLQTVVDERTAWAQQAVADLDACRALVRELQATVEARTQWAQRTGAELDTCRARVTELQDTVDARTGWAQRAIEESNGWRARATELQDTVEARSTWAQEASAELDRTRAVVEDLRRTVDDRTEWARRAVAEAEHLRELLATQTQTLESITNSQTWRAGAPLRKMKRLFNGAR